MYDQKFSENYSCIAQFNPFFNININVTNTDVESKIKFILQVLSGSEAY